MLGREQSALENSKNAILDTTPGADLHLVEADVSDPEAVRNAFQTIFKEHGQLHVMVANAGVFEGALIGMVTPKLINDVFSVNTFGTLYCAQYASRLIARAGGGSIINISSIIGTHGELGQSVYAGSKAAVIGITNSLSKELAPQNVRVNCIAPGVIDTDMARCISNDRRAEKVASISMGRMGTPGEVADVALFLASDLSRYVTGQTIGVDGGMVI
jgi:3-oxoacyl-[acyl-carrier protein] reductase